MRIKQICLFAKESICANKFALGGYSKQRSKTSINSKEFKIYKSGREHTDGTVK
jgi:hypothetical protein